MNNLFNPKQIINQDPAVTFQCNYCFVIKPFQNPLIWNSIVALNVRSTNIHRFCGKQKVAATFFSIYD